MTRGGSGARRDGSAGHAGVFQMSVQEPSSPGDLDPYPVTDAPSTSTGTTLDCEEPLNRIEAQFTALRYFTLDGTDHPSHKEQASMIRRYIIWRNNHTYDQRLHRIVDRANVA